MQLLNFLKVLLIYIFILLSLRPYLHGGDDHASVHDELTQCCRALVAVPAVNHEEATDVLKLSDGEVCGQRRLLPFLFTHRKRVPTLPSRKAADAYC